jgi:hypothetical protein
MTQSFNIPDSISSEALEDHLKNAPTDAADKVVTKDHFDDVFDEAEHWVQRAASSSNNPLIVHKLMMVYIIDRMIHFHERVAEDCKLEDKDSSAAWLKDAGKFQAMINILQTIECGPDDPMCASCGGHD